MSKIFLFTLLHFFAFFMVSNCQTCKPYAGNVFVKDGAYEGILVVIDNNINHHPAIIPNIKDYFQSASDALFHATKRVSGRYFGNITILVPKHWPADETVVATTESAHRATFSVELDVKNEGGKPYTVRLTNECGRPGKKTVLPESFVASKERAESFGKNIGKTLVREWGFLRYGLFDESVTNEDKKEVSCHASDKVPRCSKTLTGNINSRGDAVSCTFEPDDHQTSGGSLLFASHIDSIYTFCDDNTTDTGILHDPNTDTMQNARCGLRSAWSVMRGHEDFASGVQGAVATRPVSFRVVRDDILHISIVMDVSGSMEIEENRFKWMRQNVESFLRNLLHISISTRTDVMVGLSQFHTTAMEKHPMVILNQTNIESLLAAIPDQTHDETSIGSGIRQGLQVLKKQEQRKRSILLVFTDGKENEKPSIEQVWHEVCEAEAIVYGILVAKIASNHSLIKLSEDTGGSSCIYDDKTKTTMYDCLWDAIRSQSPHMTPVELAANVAKLTAQISVNNQVTVDSVYSQNAVFRFEWALDDDEKKDCKQLEVTLLSPDGKRINSTNTADYKKTQTSINIYPASKKAGVWNYTIRNPSQSTCSVRVTVESYKTNRDNSDTQQQKHIQRLNQEQQEQLPQQAVEIAIQLLRSVLQLTNSTESEQDKMAIYAEVTKGKAPVAGARVKAIVTKNDGEKQWEIDLLDNGAGADLRQNDGIYSRYFVEFDGDGIYNVRVEVTGEHGKVFLYKETRSEQATHLSNNRKNATIEQTEAFQRSQVAGHMEITGYSQFVGNKKLLYGPDEIKNLHASPAKDSYKTLILTWTAVGATLDQGNASSYDVRISNDRVQLQRDFLKSFQVKETLLTTGSLHRPKPAGQVETIVLSLAKTKFSEEGRSHFVAIVAENEHGQRGKVSNVAIFEFYKASFDYMVGDDIEDYLLDIKWAILSAVGLGTIILVLLLVVAVVYRRMKNGNTKKDHHVHTANEIQSNKFQQHESSETLVHWTNPQELP